VFIVIPLTAGTVLRWVLIRKGGKDWFEKELLPRLAPLTITALLATLVFIFAFQADNITNRSFHVFLIAIPITLQVYLNSSLAYGLMKLLKVEHSIAAPGALIGASNFFELAVATAIALFGAGIRGSAGNRCWRIGGSPGDAFGLCGVQPDPALVFVPACEVAFDYEETCAQVPSCLTTVRR
jgi:ACR3 family arsenite efflux pump ArsB